MQDCISFPMFKNILDKVIFELGTLKPRLKMVSFKPSEILTKVKVKVLNILQYCINLFDMIIKK